MTRQAALGLTMVAWSAVAVAQPASDVTGVYRKDGAELAVVQGDKEALLHYTASFSQGPSAGTCKCPLILQRKEFETRWVLKSTDVDDTWALRLEPSRLVLEAGMPGCCSAGWPGSETFSRTGMTPLQNCKVKAPRAYFHDSDEKNTQRKAFVVTGAAVQVYVPTLESDLVPVRLVKRKSATVGLLRREHLDCKALGSAVTVAKSTVDVMPLAGRWVQVERKGKGYVIERYCSSATPGFNLQASGAMDVNLGQEDESLKVTGARPGAAGAYTLEVTSSSGSRETLKWTVADAKRSVIRLKGGAGFFRGGMFFVHEAKKGVLPVHAQKCDGSE